MCFSATASFTVATALAGVGLLSTDRAGLRSRRLFAAIPLLFAAQQATEGMVWLTLPEQSSGALHHLAVMAFLAIALVVWPVVVPLSLRSLEVRASRQRLLNGALAFGAVASAVALAMLLTLQPTASISGHHIKYDFYRASSAVEAWLLLVGYAVPTVTPFFLSSRRGMATIGLTLSVALVVTVIVERETLTSVWCFFAAILSVQILALVTREQPHAAVHERVGAAL
jgi:hypothetical protein